MTHGEAGSEVVMSGIAWSHPGRRGDLVETVMDLDAIAQDFMTLASVSLISIFGSHNGTNSFRFADWFC